MDKKQAQEYLKKTEEAIEREKEVLNFNIKNNKDTKIVEENIKNLNEMKKLIISYYL